VQATVARFYAGTHRGAVLLDDGTWLAFDAEAFGLSGLRLLRPGQRVAVWLVDGRLAAIRHAGWS
jgi:hypothetical protein